MNEDARYSRGAGAGDSERLPGMQRVRDLSRDGAAGAAQQLRAAGSPPGLLQARHCLSVASEPSISGRPPWSQPPGMLQVGSVQTFRICPCSAHAWMCLHEQWHACMLRWRNVPALHWVGD